MIALSRYAAGIEPTVPGYAEWRVLPQLGNFTSVSATVPSEIGLIDVTITAHEMTITSPGGTATIYIPLSDGTAASDIHADSADLSDPQTVSQNGICYAVYTVSEPGTYRFLVN